ncbi:16S rRNA (cytidine(1402)-2'-O)-methyltransferase [Aestuariivirga sp.]|uniref:16S rRNA (cytidine(1402)-2'-O)-methyltransferase n=1 Tax=Aestuariivirga sp. TaxID=2650926 RepID=UPI0025C1865E|nr:16S rRNA (cytidine(1402)-2'-O)-methyltransferase [Aestuariivirga sp.]MCA3555941.1 16S rRNA (cytidine(1402)-2'-O)-methyltransferase [Aestuariivirga sp.]
MTAASPTYIIGAHRFEAEPLAPGLYVVATPIGNLGDITVRALATLAAAETVLCEDTRTSGKLMERYAIKTRLAPYHEHNARDVRPGILARLEQGAAIALISDAGMPLVSDPGYRLVREAAELGIPVTACPGASAVLAGLALSGLPTDRFLFAGFVPQKQGERKRLFAEFAALKATLIFFESPHRIAGTLRDLAAALPGRHVAVSRELTKLHEEVLRGTADDIAAQLEARASVKGEITLLVGPPGGGDEISEADLDAAISDALAGMPASKAASEVARRFNLGRSVVYQRILARKDGYGE